MREILQTEASESGLACIAMLSSYHGHHIDLQQLRRRFPTSLKGSALPQLIKTADALVLAARAVRAEMEELEHLQLPAVLHWNMNHFVVLKRLNFSGKNAQQSYWTLATANGRYHSMNFPVVLPGWHLNSA
ncbi:cysteine peptidase family C39 domain-containing protein [Massilia sp. Root351]|jgi:ABC-type bacteriocin/lantibiotic exporter with double-glycine peptidase domain|uniref:cysteine peptidase family C39 domain-containing protein n=1 Tax=Massilia sp. Root351 TaxID=1736522 RepID=UPI0009ECBD71